MATKCISLVRGRRARFTRLDACGRPVYGPESQVVTEGFVSVSYTANVDEGEEISLPNAAGKRCVYEPAVPSFLGYTVEVAFCNVDPDLFAMATGQRTLTDANGDVVGFTMDTSVDTSQSAFALEVWAGAPTSGGCAEGSEGSYGYVLLPFVQGGIVGDFTIENDAVTFTISQAATRDGNGWGVGPYDVVLGVGGTPQPLFEPVVSTEALVMLITGMAPPDPECGARPLLEPEGAALTGVTTTPTGLSVEFEPEPVGVDPFWIDFGDGEWDYSEDGSALTHVYEEAGTYTFVAYRGTSTFEDSVTVTV
jgi:hypothetical protein